MTLQGPESGHLVPVQYEHRTLRCSSRAARWRSPRWSPHASQYQTTWSRPSRRFSRPAQASPATHNAAVLAATAPSRLAASQADMPSEKHAEKGSGRARRHLAITFLGVADLLAIILFYFLSHSSSLVRASSLTAVGSSIAILCSIFSTYIDF